MVSMNSVSKQYEQGEKTIHALRNISLEIEDGDFVSIIGKSGSGKSTLLHLLGALDKPTSGSILVNGQDIVNFNESQRCYYRLNTIGFVFQFFNLIPELTVRENILFPAQMKKEQSIDYLYIDKLTKALGLSARTEHLPDQLSGGEMQRTAVARALSTKPKLLLLDEPTGNLDEESSNSVMQTLQIVRELLPIAIVLITHDLDIAHYAKRIIRLKDGNLEDFV